MEKFNRTLRGYDPEEVNAFLDQIISQVEKMVDELKRKDKEILMLKKYEHENIELQARLKHYVRMEGTLNKALIMAQRTSDQITSSAHQESQILIEEAKRNANRIVNEALVRAEKTDMEAAMLRRNINVFKRSLKAIVEQQLEIVNDIEKVDF